MTPTESRLRLPNRPSSALLALLCAALLVPGEGALLAQEAPTPAASAAVEEAPVKLPADQLDSLVAPIALYPDPLLAQTLVASTYPLELVQLSQWLAKHKDLKDKALADAVAKEPWDPSIQSMAAVPEVVKRLADDIQWTTQLGDAFLDQQSDVMDAVQRMRKKAEDKGALKSNEQQKVETKVVEEKTVIVVQQTNPEVVYVPSYSPTVVYGASYYPYPPIYYPPYYAGAALVTFGVGMAMGAAIWGGSCCGCGWGGNNTININNNNNFNRNSNINSGNRGQGAGGGNSNWKHNSQHRGGAPYSNKATANKYGGSARGESAANRGQGGAGNRGGSAGVSNRSASGTGSRGGGAGGAGVSDRSGGGAGSRGGSSGGFSGGGGAGGDRVGGQSISSGGSSKGGFGGGSGGYSGSSARSSSSRGSSSMSSSRGGGGGSRGGGGGRGGGRR
jgi:hypothetical protein